MRRARRRSRDHRHVKEPIVGDIDFLSFQDVSQVRDLPMVDPTRPGQFGCAVFVPERHALHIAGNIGQERSLVVEQIQHRLEPGSIQASKQIQQLTFAAAWFHGRGAQ